MEVIKRNLLLILSFAILILIFKAWFLPGIVTGGDFWPGYSSMNGNIPLYPYAWHWGQNSGLGGISTGLLWFFTTSAVFTAIYEITLRLPVELAERFSFLFPFLIISYLSSAYLFRKIFPKNIFWILSSLVYTLNTYVLMIVGGGQIFIMLAYAIVPLVIYSFIKIVNCPDRNKPELKLSILAGVTFALQAMFDIRIAYLTLFTIVIYWLLKIIENRKFTYFSSSLIFVFVIPGAISILIHAFWLLPIIIIRENPLGQLGAAFTTANAVNFFSFAGMERSISLLQPNWPENIFGKVDFMRSEFLLLPVLAFSSLLFVNNEAKDKKIYILFFALIGLFGAFLAKGTSDPFGGIYLWLFSHVPGFIMFRDPTKWYTLVAVSYSILIPFSIWNIYSILSSKFKVQSSKEQLKIQNFIPNIFLILTTLYLILLIRPALFGQLTGTFRSTTIPKEYIVLEKFLSNDTNFYRTLWMPVSQRFGYYSNVHPSVSAQNFFKLTDLQKIYTEINESQLLLQEAGIKYLIVPYDSQEEIFLSDRKYDEKVYIEAINNVSQVPWLKKIKGFNRITVFEVSNPKDHFWSPNLNLKINYKYVGPVEYRVEVKNAKKGDLLVFSESYDSKWIAISGNAQIESKRYGKLFNSFILNENGDYELKIYYTPQKYVELGLIVSSVTIISIVAFLIINCKRSKK